MLWSGTAPAHPARSRKPVAKPASTGSVATGQESDRTAAVPSASEPAHESNANDGQPTPGLVSPVDVGTTAAAISGNPPAPPPPVIQEDPETARQQVADRRAPIVVINSHKVRHKGSLTLELELLFPGAKTDPTTVEFLPRVDNQVLQIIDLEQSRNVKTGMHYTLTVAVPERDFEISVVAKADDTTSVPTRLRIRQTSDGPAVDTRGALFILTVGVGNYLNKVRLNFPAKDAQDLANALIDQRHDLFREIHDEVLVQNKATLNNIREKLKWLIARTGPNDTAVVFLAGHGYNDPAGKYFYLPYEERESDALESDLMLSGAELQQALRAIQGKVVLMLDTCHSGNVLVRGGLTRLINELTAENRIVVFAASTGDQSSLESKAWQNGAFTKAVVEGLKGTADYLDDGQITMSELETWTGSRVKQLTGGSQTPTLAKPNAAPDYSIAALPNGNVLPNPKQKLRRQVLWGVLGSTAGVGLVVLIGVLAARPWEPRTLDLTF